MTEPSRIPLRLSLDEAVILLIGVRLLGEMVESIEINGVSHERLIPSLVEKIGVVVPEDLSKMTQEIVEDILVSNIEELAGSHERHAQDDEEEFPGPMYAIDTTLPVLVEAIEQAVSVDVTYYSMANEEVRRQRLDPYGIKQVGDLYWLVAYNHEIAEKGVYRIDRIKDLAKTGVHFDRPTGLRIDEFFAGDPDADG
ncbi:MAG: WYL domain-containing protein [Candidatus Sericytochromatia bacterium]|nr:WYL domain-containing protein [Candidatus Tanganyikabacteria bacterium]